MTTRSSRFFVLFVIAAALISFGFGAAGAREPGCECARLPDMTAFGFVTNPRPTCDRDFVWKAGDGQMLETALGERAAEQATSADVKQFGRMIAKYSTLAGDRLLEIARNNNLEVPTDMDRADWVALLHLSEMKGRDFDREYMNQVIKDHEHNVKLFERLANEADNPDLRNYARQTIPALRDHLRMARDIYSRLESQG
jgi:putative membrane protein